MRACTATHQRTTRRARDRSTDRGTAGRACAGLHGGTYDLAETYKTLDVVAFNKGSFVARHDDPGECPGDGWQLLTSYGKRGDQGSKGERGERGVQGERGDPAPFIVGWQIDRRAFQITPRYADGSEGPAILVRELFEQFVEERRA